MPHLLFAKLPKRFHFFATIQKATFAKLWWLHWIASVDAKNASFSEQHCVTILFLCNSLQYITSWSFLLFISFYSFIIDLIIFNEILWDSINQLFYSIPNLNCLDGTGKISILLFSFYDFFKKTVIFCYF